MLVAEVGEQDLQMVEYGYSIITYAIRYDKAWIELVEQLRDLLRRRCRVSIPSTAVQYFPDETVRKVMEYLDEAELRKAAVVSVKWNVLSSEDHLWDHLLRTKFGVTVASIHIKNNGRFDVPLTPKLLYREMWVSFLNVLRLMEGEKLSRERLFVPSYIFQQTTYA